MHFFQFILENNWLVTGWRAPLSLTWCLSWLWLLPCNERLPWLDSVLMRGCWAGDQNYTAVCRQSFVPGSVALLNITVQWSVKVKWRKNAEQHLNASFCLDASKCQRWSSSKVTSFRREPVSEHPAVNHQHCFCLSSCEPGILFSLAQLSSSRHHFWLTSGALISP